MTDLSVKARLDADGTRLVGQLNEAEIKARGLEGALEEAASGAQLLSGAADSAGHSAGSAAGQFDRFGRSQQESARAGRENADAQTALSQAATILRTQLDPMYAAQLRFDQELTTAQALLNAGAITTKEYAAANELARQRLFATNAALHANSAELDAATLKNRAFGFALQNAGYQVGDFFVQVGAGTSAVRALALQGPQFFQAIALMGNGAEHSKGKFAAFANFLSGPWGVAATVAVSIAGALATSLLATDDASSKATRSSYDFSDGLDVLSLKAGQASDAMQQLASDIRSAIAVQGDFLRSRQAVAQQAVTDLEGRLQQNRTEAADLKSRRSGTLASILPAFFGPSGQDLGREAKLNAQIAQDNQALTLARQSLVDGAIAISEQTAAEARDPLAAARGKFERAVADLVTRRRRNANDPLAEGGINQVDFDAEYARLLDQKKAAEEAAKNAKSSPAAYQKLTKFGDSAGETVQRFLAGYDPAPRETDKALQDIRSIDRLMAELEKRKPPGFEATIASAQQAKTAIENGLGKPIADIAESFSETPKDLAQAKLAFEDLNAIEAKLREAKPPNLDQLLAQLGDARQAVNDSLVRPFQQILTDQRQHNELLRLAAEGRHEEAAQLQLIQGLMRQVGVESESQLATELAKRGVTASMLENMLQGIALEGRLSEAAQRRIDLQRNELQEVDRFQGNIETFFADVSQKGIKALGDFAGNVKAQVSDYFARYLTETIFGGVFRQLEAQISGQDQVRQANKAYVGQIGEVVKALRRLETAADGAAAATDGSDPIVVTAQRQDNPFDFKLKSPRELFGELAETLLKKLGLQDLAKDIGQVVGSALQGAVIGSAANSLLLGSKGDQTASAIGGALGQVAGEALGKSVGGLLGSALGPIGSIAGGLLGGVVGGLFKKTPDGNLGITGQDSRTEVRSSNGEVGNSLASLAGQLTSSLQRIADAFGGEVGAYSVSLGQRNDYYRVGADASFDAGQKYPTGALYDGTDPQKALQIAIQNALSDGAIKGISAAVQQALRSSPDIDAAIQEALKVKQVEDLLTGLGDGVSAELQAFQRTADERLRIAKQYGFDVLAIEKRNAEDRAALVDKILADRVGSLQQLLDDLNIGDLSEGTLAERRAKLKEQIAQAEQAAQDGEDGAADRLANLSRQLVELSKEAFGTAGGEYSADRNQAITSAQKIIDLEKERVANAQTEVTDRLDQSNSIANETNNLLAGIQAGINRLGAFTVSGTAGASLGGAINTSRAVLR